MNIPPGFRIVAETSAFERTVAEMVRRVPAGKGRQLRPDRRLAG